MRGHIRIPTQLWKAYFNYVFVNVWCAVLDDQLIGPFILEGSLTGEAYLRFLQEELPRLLEDVPLNKRGLRISNMTELLILHVKLEIS